MSAPGPAGTFVPRPGAAPATRMVTAQARLELRLLLRNGEQLVLTLVLPVLLLLGLVTTSVVDLGLRPGQRRVDVVTPGILALAIMSTAFTGQAIATGFERRYGVLKRLGATPLPRWGLLAGKVGAILAVQLLQIVLLAAVALGLGWAPAGSLARSAPAVVVLALLGTAAFTGLALLMAGTLRAELTLALANLVYLLLLLGGGVLVPLSRYPQAAQAVLGLTPLAALSEGMRAALEQGVTIPVQPIAVLACWALACCAAAAAAFRWE